jgi:hypothetical protein
MSAERRRVPPRWTVDETDACVIMKDATENFGAHCVELTGVSSVAPGLDFFAGGPEYFKISPFTWQDNELIPVLIAKPAE